MVVTTAIVLLPLYSAFSAQAGQEVQQDNSLEGRIAQLQQKIEQKPRDPDLHFELNKLYEEDVGRYYDEALSEFKEAVDKGLKGKTVIWNDLGTLSYNKGAEFLGEGKYDEAIEKFEDARKWNPNDVDIYNNIAIAYRFKGDLSEAVEFMKKAVDLDPANDVRYQTLGIIYAKIGIEKKDFVISLLNFDKVLHLNPKNKEIYFAMGLAQQNLGEYDEAIKSYKNHLKYYDSEDAKANIKECKRLK